MIHPATDPAPSALASIGRYTYVACLDVSPEPHVSVGLAATNIRTIDDRLSTRATRASVSSQKSSPTSTTASPTLP